MPELDTAVCSLQARHTFAILLAIQFKVVATRTRNRRTKSRTPGYLQMPGEKESRYGASLVFLTYRLVRI